MDYRSILKVELEFAGGLTRPSPGEGDRKSGVKDE